MSRCDHETRTARRAARALGSVIAILLVVGIASASCGEASPAATVDRTLTGTVALGNERTLIVDSVVKVVVEGRRRQNDITYRLDATVTASTSSTAERAAKRIAVAIDRPNSTVRLTVVPPPVGTLSGTLRITAPSDLDLGVIQRVSNVDVFSMEGDVQIDSAASVMVADCEGTVSIGVRSGNVLIDSAMPAGKRTEVLVNAGDIQLTVPAGLSASFDANAGGGGSVAVSHPQLPPAQAGRRYVTTVAGGLNTVVLSTNRGNVIIRTR